MVDEEKDQKDPAQNKQPSTVDAVLPEYISLHESTGESYESMAARVESQGSKHLADRLRKLKNDSDAHKRNTEINRDAAAEARRAAADDRSAAADDRSAAPTGRQAPGRDKT